MRRHLVARLVLLLLLGGVSLLMSGRAGASTTPAAGITRTIEPVVLTGARLPAFADAPVGELFVYVNRAGAWSQVPFQVDEVGSNGRIVASGNGLFGGADELVFMAKDLGVQAAMSGGAPAGLPGTGAWYQVEVSDPLDATAKGYAYVVRSNGLRPSFGAGYVQWDATNTRIGGETYALGFSLTDPQANWFDYLALGNTTDILDRTPKLVGCIERPLICLTDEDLKGNPLALIKAGPVRAIVRGGSSVITNEIVAYGAMASGTTLVSVPIPPSIIRFSTDFNANAVGARYYNAAAANGVTIDGVDDEAPRGTPFSPWWQVSAANGTVISASDPGPAGGTPANFYQERLAPCTDADKPYCDTGDGVRYGDTGIQVTQPNNVFTYKYNFYFLPGQQPNVGATYADYFSRPLTAATQEATRDVKVYLPLVMK